MRAVLLILDGVADRPWPVLEGRTPLEAARTPSLDRLAAAGQCGMLHPLGRGRAPGSELAHFALFGHPAESFPGRSLFEAYGEGMDVAPGEVVMRGLFAQVEREADGTIRVVKRRAEIDDETCRVLSEAIGSRQHDGSHLEWRFTSAGQGLLYVRGEASAEVTDGDPFEDGRPAIRIRPLAGAAHVGPAHLTAEALDAFLRWSHEVLAGHPLNVERRAQGLPAAEFLLLKWPASPVTLPSFRQLWGFRPAAVSTGFLFRGMAKALGFEHYDTRYLSDPGEDIDRRLEAAERALTDGCDFVHIHTKLPDVAAHTKDPAHKRDVIEAIDSGLGRLFDGPLAAGDVTLVVTGDHATPSGTSLIHSGDPVPLAIRGPALWPDAVDAFSERACAAGSLGHLEGRDLMPMLLNLTDRVRYLGMRPLPEDLPYRSDDAEPFRL